MEEREWLTVHRIAIAVSVAAWAFGSEVSDPLLWLVCLDWWGVGAAWRAAACVWLGVDTWFLTLSQWLCVGVLDRSDRWRLLRGSELLAVWWAVVQTPHFGSCWAALLLTLYTPTQRPWPTLWTSPSQWESVRPRASFGRYVFHTPPIPSDPTTVGESSLVLRSSVRTAKVGK